MKKWLPLISVSLVSILLGVFIGILVARNRNPDILFNSEQWQAGNIAQTLGGDVDPGPDMHARGEAKPPPTYVAAPGSDGCRLPTPHVR